MALILVDAKKGTRHEVPKAVERSLPDDVAKVLEENQARAAEGKPPKPVPQFDKKAHREAAIQAWAKKEGITLNPPEKKGE